MKDKKTRKIHIQEKQDEGQEEQGRYIFKESRMNGFVLEMLKNGGITIIEWLLRIFNICMEFGAVPENWKATCIIPIYNGQSDRRECANY